MIKAAAIAFFVVLGITQANADVTLNVTRSSYQVR
jgi:hypothetical protein